VKNGLTFPEYLSEIASYGFVVVADGPPVTAGTPSADSQARRLRQRRRAVGKREGRLQEAGAVRRSRLMPTALR
jgi:hypothetical protein